MFNGLWMKMMSMTDDEGGVLVVQNGKRNKRNNIIDTTIKKMKEEGLQETHFVSQIHP
jgi:hypothetical protein